MYTWALSGMTINALGMNPALVVVIIRLTESQRVSILPLCQNQSWKGLYGSTKDAPTLDKGIPRVGTISLIRDQTRKISLVYTCALISDQPLMHWPYDKSSCGEDEWRSRVTRELRVKKEKEKIQRRRADQEVWLVEDNAGVHKQILC